MAERLTELTPDDRHRAETVLVEHRRLIEAVAMRYAPNFDAVSDIVQEVSVKVCQSLHTFRGDADIKTWLYRITQTTAVTAFRTQASQQRTADAMAQQPEPIVDIEDDVVDEDFDAERRTVVRRLLRGSSVLTARQREALRHVQQPGRVRLQGGDRSALFRAKARIRLWIRTHRPELIDDDE
jgi:RNA polymerase sigma factor (sigma-70 family)